MSAGAGARRPILVHLTTTDMSLDWLLGPQLSAFAEDGYDVVGVSAAGPHVAALVERGIRHVALASATRSMDPRRDVQAFAELVGVLRRLRPTILHTHNPKPGLYGRVAGRLTGVPVIVNTVHGLYALPEDRLAKRAVVYGLERAASTCSRAELVQNPEDLETLARIGVPRSKLVLLGNGIDLARFDPFRLAADARARARAAMGVTDDDVVVGLVGRLVAEKGYREVFAAARLLRSRCPNVRVVVIGPDDPDKAAGIGAEELAAATRDGGVRFLGRRDDVDLLYAGMDLYVLASYREGFPRSAMEAAAMGLPIVATDIRGCRQVVEDGRTGVLVPVGDVVALTEAIGWLAGAGDVRAAMGEAARQWARAQFDQQDQIDTTLATDERLRRAEARSR
jgi:glycosyltransferase involved in cell wall biosynthesis